MTVSEILRDHIGHFTEADIEFLNMDIHREWLAETRKQTVAAYFKFTHLLTYWGFISKISPRERDELAKLFREANKITKAELKGV